MATLEQLEQGLRAADAAGNADDARAFASEIMRMRSAPPAPSNEGIPSERQTRSWADVPKEAIASAPSSVGKMVKGMVDVGAGTLRNMAQTVTPAPVFETLDIGPGGDEASAAATAMAELPRGLRYKALNAMFGPKVAAAADALTAAPITPASVMGAGGVAPAVKPALETQGRAAQTGEAIIKDYAEYLEPGVLKERIATDPARVAADLSMVSSLLGKGASVANMPRAATALETAATYTNPMTPVAAGARGAANAMASGTEFLRNYMAPKHGAYLEAAEGNAPAILTLLQNAKEKVPGSSPTAAQAAAEANATKFAALGETAAGVLPTEYFGRKQEQRAARVGAMEQMTPQPAAPFKTLEEGRAAASGPLYKAAEAQPNVPERGAFAEIMNRPSMQDAINEARREAVEAGRPFSVGQNKPAEYMAGMEVSPQTFREYPVSSLLDVKVNLDKLIANAKTGKTTSGDLLGMESTRRALVNWLEKNIPGYEEAKGTHRLASVSIDQRKTMDTLKDKLTSALSEEAPQKAASFAEGLRNAPTTIKKATGEARYKSLDEYMSPDQLNMLDNIRLDLAREDLVRQQATAGRITSPRLNQLASQAEPGARLPNLFDRRATTINKILGVFEKKIDRKLAGEIADEMLRPETAAIALERAMKYQERTQEIAGGVRRRGEKGANALAAPTTLPILQIQNILANQANKNAMAR